MKPAHPKPGELQRLLRETREKLEELTSELATCRQLIGEAAHLIEAVEREQGNDYLTRNTAALFEWRKRVGKVTA